MIEDFLTSNELAELNGKIKSEEQRYIYRNLMYFIEKKAIYKRIAYENTGWEYSVDEKTILRFQVLQYIIEHLTLFDLYHIFYCHKHYIEYGFTFRSLRKGLIELINDESYFWSDDISKIEIKNKVWHIDPLSFGLVFQLVNESRLFFDENIGHVYPIILE